MHARELVSIKSKRSRVNKDNKEIVYFTVDVEYMGGEAEAIVTPEQFDLLMTEARYVLECRVAQGRFGKLQASACTFTPEAGGPAITPAGVVQATGASQGAAARAAAAAKAGATAS